MLLTLKYAGKSRGASRHVVADGGVFCCRRKHDTNTSGQKLDARLLRFEEGICATCLAVVNGHLFPANLTENRQRVAPGIRQRIVCRRSK